MLGMCETIGTEPLYISFIIKMIVVENHKSSKEQ